MKTALARLAVIGLSAWALWSVLIYQARPNPPQGLASLVFVVSMAGVAVACLWACWQLLPRPRPWRRAANVLIGLVAFAVILGVGHRIGLYIAQGA